MGRLSLLSPQASSLATLQGLEVLVLANNPVSDISPLLGLQNLVSASHGRREKYRVRRVDDQGNTVTVLDGGDGVVVPTGLGPSFTRFCPFLPPDMKG